MCTHICPLCRLQHVCPPCYVRVQADTVGVCTASQGAVLQRPDPDSTGVRCVADMEQMQEDTGEEEKFCCRHAHPLAQMMQNRIPLELKILMDSKDFPQTLHLEDI